ncbi:holo-ACP synthase [Egicoccus halophilus]|uniref:Holo-[acyl-carrier-protein] synthase n=1 Tax=Egicoccus halophilus TaxID=1670830 RepID=A0A8J3A874_9ACTN|nr:holo-ACP synthase [Egicoccus halophilus]GGI06266.1 holo-[acyl-carrier-protein] synthase [Egicoccus halophilus]
MTLPPPTATLVTGCDVVDIARLSAAIDRRAGFLERVFTDRERADARRGDVAAGSPVERSRLAARFAAKEATRKALGDLRLPFHAVEVRTAASGAPQLFVHGRPSPLACSLAHDGGVAMAVVVGPAFDAATD